MYYRRAAILISLLAVALPQVAAEPGKSEPSPAGSGDNLLANGDLRDWTEAGPVGWSVSVGARTGTGSPSLVKKLPERGLYLQGTAATQVWHAVAQEVPATSGSFFRLTYEARSKDVRREGRQFDNCYVALAFHDAAGKLLARQYTPIEAPQWQADGLGMRAPENSATAAVSLFLSKSGLLGVRDLRLTNLEPGDSFDLLVAELGRHYSFFALKKIDWPTLAANYRAPAEAAGSAEEFIAAVRPLLGELNDPHVWLVDPRGRRVDVSKASYRGNFDFQAVVRQLRDVKQIGRIGFIGRTPAGFGYVAVGSLSGDAGTFGQFEQAFRQLLDAPGLLVDLRANSGGDERRGRSLAGWLTAKPVVYALSRFRSGPEPDALTPPRDRVLEPSGEQVFAEPVVCLIGPGCISSGEGMALMLKAIPGVQLVGQPTRGASGNPAPLELPNGVTVFFSRWLSLEPDGTPIEGRGVEPNVRVDHRGDGDPTYDRAVEVLAELTKSRSGKTMGAP